MNVTKGIPVIGYIETQGDKSLGELGNISNVERVVESTKNDDIVIRNSVTNNTLTLSKQVLPDLFSYEWAIKRITNMGETYSINNSKRNSVNIAIIDSGIDTDHEAFKGSIDLKHSENLVPSGGYEGKEVTETGDVNNIEDIQGHGTAVAGVIAAMGKMFGVSPGANLQIYRVFGSSQSKESWILQAIIDATNNGAHIINLSLGQYIKIPNNNVYESVDACAYKLAIDYATRHNVIVVAAAGNDGLNEENNSVKEYYDSTHKDLQKQNYTVLDYPVSLSNVIAVGSSDNNEKLSSFSNYYSSNKYNFILAPGGGTDLLNQYGEKEWYTRRLFMQEEVLSTNNDGNYNYFAGTSISAGEISGELAEIISRCHLQSRTWLAKNILLNYTNKIKGNYREASVYKAFGGY